MGKFLTVMTGNGEVAINLDAIAYVRASDGQLIVHLVSSEKVAVPAEHAGPLKKSIKIKPGPPAKKTAKRTSRSRVSYQNT